MKSLYFRQGLGNSLLMNWSLKKLKKKKKKTCNQFADLLINPKGERKMTLIDKIEVVSLSPLRQVI